MAVDAEIRRQLADLGGVQVVRRAERQRHQAFIAQAVGALRQEVPQRGRSWVLLRVVVQLAEDDPARLGDSFLELILAARFRGQHPGQIIEGEAADLLGRHLAGRARAVEPEDDLLDGSPAR